MRHDELPLLAYSLLTQQRESPYTFTFTYSRRFKPYNATATLRDKQISFRLSTAWKDVDPSILIGLLQHLLVKLLKLKASTVNMDLYTSFLKNLGKHDKQDQTDERLVKLYDEVNATFFNGLLPRPRLVWQGKSLRTLAVYEYHTDTIRISEHFKHAPDHLVKFLIYHESLHKFLQYEEKNGRARYHTPRFRQLERLYPDYERVERELAGYVRSVKATRSAAYKPKGL